MNGNEYKKSGKTMPGMRRLDNKSCGRRDEMTGRSDKQWLRGIDCGLEEEDEQSGCRRRSLAVASA